MRWWLYVLWLSNEQQCPLHWGWSFPARNNTGERIHVIIHSLSFHPFCALPSRSHVMSGSSVTAGNQPGNQTGLAMEWSWRAGTTDDMQRLEHTTLARQESQKDAQFQDMQPQKSVTGWGLSLEWFAEWLLKGLLFQRSHIFISLPHHPVLLCSRATHLITPKLSGPPKKYR